MQLKNIQKGFTTFELLITLSVVAILTTFIILPLRNVEKVTRDTRRLADLDTIYRALLFYETKNGSYPILEQGNILTPFLEYPSSIVTSSVDGVIEKSLPWSTLQKKLAPYLGSLPKDPLNNETYLYGYVVYLDSKGDLITLWINPKDCSLSLEKKPNTIPHRGVLFAQSLETRLGTNTQICNPAKSENQGYWRPLP